jgi:hypothetical protein
LVFIFQDRPGIHNEAEFGAILGPIVFPDKIA